MATALLRVEGVNFDSSVLDTNDLSTIRGGSFLFLDVIWAIDAALQRATADPPPTPPLLPASVTYTPLIRGPPSACSGWKVAPLTCLGTPSEG